ncbi:MAB_1171c family putative transporter [Streptomyces leeuwenhoekii]|uniref:MAB_1171c family putative transporter n=1 Tax=Streptomyces leeuwenhoekii TaxID=1437453 RepID=UPI0036FEF30A
MSHQVLIAALLWAVALWRAPALRHSHKQRSLEICFLSLAAAMTFEIPQVGARADALTGVVSIDYLVKHVLGVVSAAALLDFITAVVRPGGWHQRSRRVTAATCLVLMCAAFALAPAQAREPDDILAASGHRPSMWALLHIGLFTLYIGVAMVLTAALFATAARKTADRWVRTGHSLIVLGGLLGVLYALQRLALLCRTAAGDMTVTDVRQAAVVSTDLKVAAIVAIVLGSSLAPVSVAATAWREHRALRYLDPLWSGLTQAVPSVRLAFAVPPRRTRLRLHRRLVEISDATLALREYVPAEVQQRALDMAERAGYPPEARPAVAEAAWLKTATLATGRGPCAGEHPQPGGAGLSKQDELRWIRRVSAAYDRCPAVTAFATAEATAMLEEHRKQKP